LWCIEEFLSPPHGFASSCIRVLLGAGQLAPGIEQRERTPIEPRTQDVVDANVERLPGQRHWSTGPPAAVKTPAALSVDWAVNSPISNLTIASRCPYSITSAVLTAYRRPAISSVGRFAS